MTFINLAVIVGSLGYFVDIFDLFLFSIVRISSLKSLGVLPTAALDVGVFLLNSQMAGLLIGGLVWGMLGDRKGRRTVLFGSILLYSLANILNAWVTTVPAYAACRFLAGLGLAGELGAAIVLVSESLSAKDRGYGTMIVASVGLLGAMAAALIAQWVPWRTAYLIGGILGITLLLMRIKLAESGLYLSVSENQTPRGKLTMLISPWDRCQRYLKCILVGVPVYFVVGILITFSPEFANALGVVGTVKVGDAVLWSYLGAALGDFLSGFLSQYFHQRKIIIAVSLWINFAMMGIFFCARGESLSQFYVICGLMGFTTGYWAVLMTMAAEQFGTNLRATVTTSVPNFVRSSVIPLTLVFKYLKGPLGIVPSAVALALIVTIAAHLSLYWMRETYGQSLNFLETA